MGSLPLKIKNKGINMKYNEKILAYANKNDKIGSLSGENVYSAIVGSPSCGDGLKLDMEINNGIITKVRYKIFECGTAQASSAYAAEILEGKSVEFAKSIKDKEISDHLVLPPLKFHCSVLAEAAIKKVIQNYEQN
jgi:iron-sulfur cluster assembly enzyme ISCU, mitochondrial